MAELIDRANELVELNLQVALAKARLNREAISATHCCDCKEEIVEARRIAAPGCVRCASCQEDIELFAKQRKG